MFPFHLFSYYHIILYFSVLKRDRRLTNINVVASFHVPVSDHIRSQLHIIYISGKCAIMDSI